MPEPLIRQSINSLHADNNGRLLDVVVSRKGPFLVLDSTGQRACEFNSVTEFALPFINLSQYRYITLRDDAVYYGTTLERVTEMLLTAYVLKGGKVSDLKLVAMPLVRSVESLPIYSYVNGRVWESRDIKALDAKYIGAYINNYIDRINEMHRPYDMEEPIFEVEYDTAMDERSIVQRLVTNIEQHFGIKAPYYRVDRYNRKLSVKQGSRRYTHAWTIVLDGLFEEGCFALDPDYAKLRIYFNPDAKKALITTYCINTLRDDVLDSPDMMFADGVGRQIWRRLVQLATEDSSDDVSLADFKASGLFDGYAEDIKQVRLDNLLMNYRDNVHRSLVVVANYLISYALFHELRPCVSAAFGNDKIALHTDELYWIVGDEAAKMILNALDGGNLGIPLGGVPRGTCADTRIVPNAYVADFAAALERYDNHVYGIERSVELKVSAIFSAMHYGIELRSRLRSSNVNQRLQFGETFASLYEDIAWQWNDDPSKLRLRLHKALDSRIDSGSVVPQYVKRQVGVEHSWSRHFRPGENDDAIYDRTLRQLGAVFKGYSDLTGRVSCSLSQAVFLLMYINHCFNKHSYSLFDTELSFRFEDECYHAYTIVNGVEIDVIDLAVNCGMIDDNLSLMSLSYGEISNALLPGNVLSDQEEDKLTECLSALEGFARLSPTSDTFYREASNWLAQPDEATKRRDMQAIVARILAFDLSQTDKGIPADISEVSDSFFNIYLSLPDKDNTLSRVVEKLDDVKAVYKPLFENASQWTDLIKSMEVLYFALLLLNMYYCGYDAPDDVAAHAYLSRYNDDEILVVDDGVNPPQRLDVWISDQSNNIVNLPSECISGVLRQICCCI